uniref:CARD domain-containing protein n=1 Tax=Plectus sambesii TaxID=2011161 RepID=A0A914WJU6_9BILA
MDVASVVDYLIGTNPPVLLRYHANEIRKIVDSDERNRKFLTILEQRGEFNAYKQFLEALKHTQQNELYTSILIQSNKLLHAKYSDKNSVGRNPELRSVSNLPLSDAAQSDNALQNQAPSTSSATPSQPNNEDWQRQLES